MPAIAEYLTCLVEVVGGVAPNSVLIEGDGLACRQPAELGHMGVKIPERILLYERGLGLRYGAHFAP